MAAQFVAFGAMLRKELNQMKAELERLRKEADETNTVMASAVAVFEGLAETLHENANNAKAINSIADDLDKNANKLAEAIAARTAAANEGTGGSTGGNAPVGNGEETPPTGPATTETGNAPASGQGSGHEVPPTGEGVEGEPGGAVTGESPVSPTPPPNTGIPERPPEPDAEGERLRKDFGNDDE